MPLLLTGKQMDKMYLKFSLLQGNWTISAVKPLRWSAESQKSSRGQYNSKTMPERRIHLRMLHTLNLTTSAWKDQTAVSVVCLRAVDLYFLTLPLPCDAFYWIWAMFTAAVVASQSSPALSGVTWTSRAAGWVRAAAGRQRVRNVAGSKQRCSRSLAC